MQLACVFYYSWVPPQLTLLALAFLTILAVRYHWRGRTGVALLASWLWFSPQPGHTYYLCFATLLLAFRLHWRGQNPRQTLTPRLSSYLLAGYLGYATLPTLAGVPLQITHWCTQCGSNLRNLATAIETYKSDHKRLPVCLEELTPTYLVHLPNCSQPAGPFYRSRGIDIREGYTYRRLPEGHYRLECPNRGISGHRTPEEAPFYDSRG